MPQADRNDQNLSPEDTLLAIFSQAFAGQSVHLPDGASVATLRRAVCLDDETIRAIFQAAKTGAGRPTAHRAVVTTAVMQPNRRPAIIGAVIAGIFGIGAAYFLLTLYRQAQTPRLSTGQIYEAEAADKSASSALAARAAGGDPEAAFDLATLLDRHLLVHETAVAKDDVAAFHWYQFAAKAGLPEAENNLGFAYQTGRGVMPNGQMAEKWYLLAAKTGLVNAQNNLGNLYQNGPGIAHNPAQALFWYQKAAAQGSAAAENSLGAAYENGLGTPQNLPLAVTWFQSAAAQGEPNAENSLGFLYYNGAGVPQDAAQSFKWFSQAAAQGNAPAQLNLGLMYARSIGVAQDNITAAKWFLLAQERGDAQSAMALGLINPPLTSGQLSAARAAAKQWDAAHNASD